VDADRRLVVVEVGLVQATISDIDRKRLTFAVKVTTESGTISEGTHQRFVVDAGQFG
jgi:fluoroacetyl-CoA thioesterase